MTLFVAGAFGRIGGADRQGLAAISTTTANATAWDARARYAEERAFVPATILSMTLSGRVLYVAGRMDTLAGRPVRSTGAVDIQTGRALSWSPPLDFVYTVAAAGGLVYVGGDFTGLGPDGPRSSLP